MRKQRTGYDKFAKLIGDLFFTRVDKNAVNTICRNRRPKNYCYGKHKR